MQDFNNKLMEFREPLRPFWLLSFEVKLRIRTHMPICRRSNCAGSLRPLGRPVVSPSLLIVELGLLPAVMRSSLTGYVTVTPDLHFEVSRRIREEFENGKDYYALHGQRIIVPEPVGQRPDPGALTWQNEHCFKG